MSKLNVLHNVGGIEGLCVISPQNAIDVQDYICETYNIKDYFESGINANFVQDNEAFSYKNVLRGFGINKKVPQSKLICVTQGRIFDVVIDLRINSSTFMKWYCIELSERNRRQLYIPERFAHAYLALEDSKVLFKVTSHFILGDEIGFAWNSKAFDINWPIEEEHLIISDRDKHNPEFCKSMVV